MAKEVKTEAMVNPDDLAFLDTEAELSYEPPIMQIKVVHAGGLFQSDGFGSGDSITGVILSVLPNRVFFGFQTDRNYPVCVSSGEDAIAGIGKLKSTPTDNMSEDDKLEIAPIIGANCICAKCRWAEYGTGTGKSQACRMSYRLLIWSPESNSYGWLAISPTSFKNWKNYKAGNQHFSRVVTKFTLSVQKKGAYTWSLINFTLDKPVDLATVEPLKKLVHYNGQEMMEYKAAIAYFKQCTVKEQDDETNGNGHITPTPTSGGKDEF